MFHGSMTPRASHSFVPQDPLLNESLLAHNVSANNAAVLRTIKGHISREQNGGTSTTDFLTELQHSYFN
jgi:hypothetical protein